MTKQFNEFDHSSEARAIMGEATRAGFTKESVGENINLALRFQRLGNTEMERQCLERAITVHTVWGSRHAAYAMNEASLVKWTARLNELA